MMMKMMSEMCNKHSRPCCDAKTLAHYALVSVRRPNSHCDHMTNGYERSGFFRRLLRYTKSKISIAVHLTTRWLPAVSI